MARQQTRVNLIEGVGDEMYVARALTGSMSDQRNVVCGIDSCIDSWIGCVRSVYPIMIRYLLLFIIIYFIISLFHIRVPTSYSYILSYDRTCIHAYIKYRA